MQKKPTQNQKQKKKQKKPKQQQPYMAKYVYNCEKCKSLARGMKLQ